MNSIATGWQEIAALVFVAAVAAIAVTRWWRSRRARQGACGSCAPAQTAASEHTLKFHRRREH